MLIYFADRSRPALRYRLPVHFSSNHHDEDEDGRPLRTLFHGTEFGAAKRILTLCQGFIVSENCCRVRNKKISGAWMVPNFADAFQRSSPERYREATGFLNRLCAPVVLEMQPRWLTKAPGCEKYCSRADPGTKHEGIIIRAIHMNIKVMANFMNLERQDVRRSLSVVGKYRLCGCGLCGAVSTPDSPDFWNWSKSNKGIYYSCSCAQRCRFNSNVVCFDSMFCFL